MLDPIPYDSLPPAWNTFDLAAFSRHKVLWDYQQAALHNAIKTLWKYYAGDKNHELPLSQEAFEEDDAARKVRFMEWYRHNGVTDNLDISLGRKRGVNDLLADFYPVDDGRIAYQHFINRMGFWMATGSGKTLVIVKLLEALWLLMQRGAIPVCDLLVLTHRDDLLAQLERHVEEFNRQGDLHIGLRELRDYAQVKRETPSLFRGRELTVFTYRSDNLSDEQKEKIVDFRNYDNHGRWYVLLDEAHKGDREESKRQHIYSILARNGFLFNFSATFTDERDKVTTAYNFNLARFVQKGYGKHITILRQENRAFRDKEDYTGEEKRKVVLKALILLTYAHRLRADLAVPDLYHRPLMLTLVNSVNTKDADLKLFFRELARIGAGQLDDRLWTTAHGELREGIAADPKLMFESERFALDDDLYRALTLEDVRRHVFNADLPGEIEVLERPSNRQEVAFKLKSGDRPFALIKIGDVSGWLKDELTGYEVISGFDDESYFEELNGD
ncbi:MAG: DEAD/DEAH box helicase family protein, partial [Candidatus Moraniibacteriota bacterium]